MLVVLSICQDQADQATPLSKPPDWISEGVQTKSDVHIGVEIASLTKTNNHKHFTFLAFHEEKFADPSERLFT